MIAQLDRISHVWYIKEAVDDLGLGLSEDKETICLFRMDSVSSRCLNLWRHSKIYLTPGHVEYMYNWLRSRGVFDKPVTCPKCGEKVENLSIHICEKDKN